ncbi:cysteine-rich receptor-like protein kinase 27 [Miscanthus floridulus]|uniref:cysteine-rich receptor-like protein kinase 27 n=1 Tax=Miscanthus floridulus TaxID=154761 RepID=UPI0034578361
MSGKRKMDQVDSGVGVGGGANGQPHHQQFVMLRIAMRKKIFEYIGKQPTTSAEWWNNMPVLTKRLEEILYGKFPNKNDYFNMMMGPIKPQLLFGAIQTLSAQQNQRNPQVERQTPPSSSSNLVVQTSQGLYTKTVHEDSRYMELNILERIVNESEEPSPLDFVLLHSITENFSEKKKIGSGGCGIVYKGILRNGVVAVKRLHSSRTIKDKMFHREVISLISVKHSNIVRFLGYCSFTKEHAIPLGGTIIMADIRERLLCFEYIRNGSLDQHLSDELRGLEWQTRYQIIIGICRGLHYLHKDKEIIHMDLKPGNILLDDLMVPKITDFGLSRPESDSLATTTRLISQGYTAPEYISGGKATSKSDIYSLGVIIIELVTGSRTKPNITKAIRRWNHRWIKSMKQSSLACQQVKKCLELALRCIQDDPTDRPDISDIIDELKEIDTTDGQAQIQISSCCLEDILGIEPLEIRIPFEDFKISHSIELTNDMDDYIAFVTKAKLERFCTVPDRGIVPPRSKCSVTLAMQTQVNAQPNVHYTEVITVLSTRVDGALSVDAMDVTSGEIFVDKEGKVVDEVNVMVVFGTPQLAEE